MSTISLTLPADGQTIDAADVNTPFNTIAAAINGGLDSDNITAGGITPASLVSGTGSSWSMQSWTPTWTNLTIGSGTNNSKYVQIGKMVFCRLYLLFAADTSISGAVSFTLPVTSVTYPGTTLLYPLGWGNISDSGTKQVDGVVMWKTTTTAALNYKTTTSNFVRLDNAIDGSNPQTPAANDEYYFEFMYEAA